MVESIYIEFVLKNLPRVFTHVDRNQYSPTFGCCDRNYWHLKIQDFSSAILQQACLTLALAYGNNFKGNIFYHNNNVFNWSQGIVSFWQSIQLKDGSFNEYFPNEHSLPATAFTLYSVSETFKIINIKNNNVLDSMIMAGKYLANYTESEASNQEIASFCALYNLYTITDYKWLEKAYKKKLEKILKKQSQEGWFMEYGGADFGYLSVSLDYLSEYYLKSKDEKVLESLNKILEFLKYFIHPDGTIGGQYGSRNTAYFLPNGLEALVSLGNKTAKDIKALIFKKINKLYFQDSIDDRYIMHYVLHSFLRAIKIEKTNQGGNYHNLPCFEEHIKYFNQSGLLTVNNGNYFLISAFKKGGLIKLYKNNKEVFVDFGYIAKNDKNVLVTNWVDDNIQVGNNKNYYYLTIKFNKIKIQTSSTFNHLVLRVAAKIFGRKIIKFLKNKLITINNFEDIKLIRIIRIKQESIVIYDQIISSRKITSLFAANNFSFRLVPSDKFFTKTDLLDNSGIEIFNFFNLKILRKFNVNSKKLNIFIKKNK